MNEEIMQALGFAKEIDRTKAGLCALCCGPQAPYQDEESAREGEISGLCQACQDGIFGD